MASAGMAEAAGRVGTSVETVRDGPHGCRASPRGADPNVT
jgi:hypothetical protein